MNIDKLPKWFKQIFMTKLGLILPTTAWFGIWYGISDRTYDDWKMWVSMLGLGYIVGLTLVMFAYAWVINPIRSYKENRNNKKKNK